jgi:hypothetical protein
VTHLFEGGIRTAVNAGRRTASRERSEGVDHAPSAAFEISSFRGTLQVAGSTGAVNGRLAQLSILLVSVPFLCAVGLAVSEGKKP